MVTSASYTISHHEDFKHLFSCSYISIMCAQHWSWESQGPLELFLDKVTISERREGWPACAVRRDSHFIPDEDIVQSLNFQILAWGGGLRSHSHSESA